MTTKTESRFSRFPFSLKTTTSPSPTRQQQQSKRSNEDWYIPYNGPYEPPRIQEKERERDSWGDLIPGPEDHALAANLHTRSGNASSSETKTTLKGRDRSQSILSKKSSAAAHGDNRPSDLSHTTAPVPTYVTFDIPENHIGASPMPPQRSSTTSPSSSSNRTSLAHFFSSTFNGGRKSTLLTHGNSVPTPGHNGSLSKRRSDEEEEYSSHLSPPLTRTLGTQSAPPASHQQQRQSPHPYSYALPLNEVNSGTSASYTDLNLNSAPPVSSHFPTNQLSNKSSKHSIMASISTPNLRDQFNNSTSSKYTKSTNSRLPKGKDRWFSAETWCDALFLPRPRFRVNADGTISSPTARIVSPPDSPVSPNSHATTAVATGVEGSGLASRVLAHSRSMAELRKTAGNAHSENHSASVQPGVWESKGGALTYRVPPPSPPKPPPSMPPPSSNVENTLRPPRPKSFALDDLALPSPVPSLSKVLEEGDLLNSQRAKWQAQATKSFQNNLTRNMSRNTRIRSKSLGKQAKPPLSRHEHLTFLAARTVLGNQHHAVTPTVVISEPANSDSIGRTSHTLSHSHKSSLSKTMSTRSSKNSRGGHSRDSSWNRTTLKNAAKGTAAFCGINGADPMTASPMEEKQSPGFVEDRPYIVTSPAPSGFSDSRVGIALSTPPPSSDISHGYDADLIRMPAHPYAQGAVHPYSSRDNRFDAENSTSAPLSAPLPDKSTYAGPHPSHPSARFGSIGSATSTADLASRHRLPPQATLGLAQHPYAAASSDDLLIKRVRSDSTVSPSQKMWAPVEPGVVQEVLPHELRYSPMVEFESEEVRRKKDRMSVGEALSLAMGRRDSMAELGRSTDQQYASGSSVPPPLPPTHAAAQEGYHVQGLSLRSKVPVQYDASRPVYQLHQQTLPSSPTIDRVEVSHPTPEMLTQLRNDSSGSSNALPSQTSSPPISPRALNSLDDLDDFRDLFFQPKFEDPNQHSNTSSRDISSEWKSDSFNRRRTGSGLTVLARQLSQEFEEINAMQLSRERDRGGKAQSPTGLQFVLSEGASETTTISQSPRLLNQEVAPLRLPEHKIHHAFEPSMTLPEDIEEEESRASSPLERISEEDHEIDEPFRVGVVEALSTPPTNFSDRRVSQRLSFLGQEEEEEYAEEHDDTVHAPLQIRPNNLQIPSANGSSMRASYMTTSTGNSRMSGLSDFPVPPAHEMTPVHMSILDSFFDDSPSDGRDQTRQPTKYPLQRRSTFGEIQEATR